MTRQAIVAACLFLVGCDQRKPYFSDAQMIEVRPKLGAMTQKCVDIIRWEGLDALPNETDQCYEMTPPQRFKGRWLAFSEGSEFCPDAQGCLSDDETMPSGIWLSFARPLQAKFNRYDGTIYAVEFIGRKTVARGHFGHFGMSAEEVIVDRMLSIQMLKPPPRRRKLKNS